MAEHTPGPWEVRCSRVSDGSLSDVVISRVGDYALAVCFWQHDGDGNAAYNAEANARLIAAAPELMEACRASLESLRETDKMTWAGELSAKLEAAIAKATGKEQE